MKLMIIFLVVLFSTSLFAVTTTLNVLTNPSTTSIDKAIRQLNKVKMLNNESDKSKHLNMARSLLEKKPQKMTFNAAIYVGKYKQFTGEYYHGEDPEDFSDVSFKGTAKEAAKLINKAIEVGFWDIDDPFITNVKANKKTVVISFRDKCNEEWKVTISTYKYQD